MRRGQISSADRRRLAVWLQRFAGRDDVAFAVEACTGWRYVVEELQRAGVAAHLAEPADTAAARGRKKHAKTDRTDSKLIRRLLEDDRVPECWIPPQQVLEHRAVLELYQDLRTEHTAWVQRVHAVLSHQGAEQLGRDGLSTTAGRERLRQVTAAQLSPAGQLQVATALRMLEAGEAELDQIRRLVAAARHLLGARVLTPRAGAGEGHHPMITDKGVEAEARRQGPSTQAGRRLHLAGGSAASRLGGSRAVPLSGSVDFPLFTRHLMSDSACISR